MLTISDQLHAVRALIENEARWCRDAFALNRNGDAVYSVDKNAVRWCVIGACHHTGVENAAKDILRRKALDMFYLPLDQVNDRSGHAAVMQLLDAAIAEAEKEHG